MARKEIVTTYCDFEHEEETEAVATKEVGYEGRHREVDVCQEHLDMLDNFMDSVMSMGRAVPGRGRSTWNPRRPGVARQRTRPAAPETVTELPPVVDPAAVRAWAVENGIQTGAKGRLSKSVMTQYLEAQPVPTSSRRRAKATA